MVSFKVEMIAVLPEDLRQPVTVQVLALSQVYGHHKQVLFKQHLKRQTGRKLPCYLIHSDDSQTADLK